MGRDHQTFQVPKMEVQKPIYKLYMDTAYVREEPPPC